jgi:hypothetical protein
MQTSIKATAIANQEMSKSLALHFFSSSLGSAYAFCCHQAERIYVNVRRISLSQTRLSPIALTDCP